MKTMVKQMISALLAAAMIISILPAGALAAETGQSAVVLEVGADIQEDSTSSDIGHSTGSDSGDSTGSDTGDSTGSDTGESTGSDTGDSTGSDTGESTGSDTGDSTGSDTGDSTGDDTGESTGDDTGDSTGSDTGDSTGDGGELDTPTDESDDPDGEADESPAAEQSPAPRMLTLRLATPDGGMLLTVSSDSLQAQIAAAEDGGTVTMDRDYTENIVFPMGKTVILDMAGHTLRPDTSETGTNIANTVTVFGTAVIKGGTISGKAEDGKTVNARGALVPNGGKLTLGQSTVVCDFTVKGSGGGIHVDGDGELELAGGTVINNRATESGGGVFIYDAEKLRVQSGTVIAGNEAANGGGIAAYQLYTYGGYLNGLTLENNKAEYGGGLYFGGQVDLTAEMPLGGVTFRGNQASQHGGGLYCRDVVTANFADMLWDGNTAAANGGAAYFNKAVNASFLRGGVQNSQSMHGALYFAAASTANFDGTTLSKNRAQKGGGALCAVGALQMELRDVTIQDNFAYTYGGAFYLAAQKNQITLLSGTISGNLVEKTQEENAQSYGGAFFFNNYSTFTMEGGTFENNTSRFRGGAVYMGTGCTTMIAGGTFRNNNAGNWGSALYMNGNLNISDVLAEKNAGSTAIVNENGSITVSGGTYRENTTAVGLSWGSITITGGTFTENSGTAVSSHSATITVSGGEIYNNTGSGVGCSYGTVNIQEGANIRDNAGWGVSNSYEGSMVRMTGGSIRGNRSGGINDYGTGFYWHNQRKGTVIVSGGEIRDNGGVGIQSGIAEISGGVISGNVGGVYGTDVTVSGGEITGNYGVDYGGGVRVTGGYSGGNQDAMYYFYSRLSVTGGVIKDNRANKQGNDIYIAKPLDNDYENATASIAAAQGMIGETAGAVWYDEIDHQNLEEAIPSRRHTEENGVEAYTFKSISDPVAQVGDTVYTSLQAAFDAIHSGTAPDSPVLLLKDDTENVTIPAGISATLDLRGHLIFTNSGTILTVGEAPAEPAEGEEAPAAPAPASLTVKDSVGGGKLTGATTGAVVVNAGSRFTMQDISIEKNYNATTAGGGVILRSGSSMTLTSGTISGNRGVGGSGIYVEKNAELTIDGGAISGNRTVASADGAANSGAIKALGRVIMNGGEITGNEISRHWQLPAVYLTGDGAYFALNKGTISGNIRGYQTSRWYSYGPVGVVQGAQMVMNGGTIENNINATDRSDGACAVRIYNSASTQCTSFTMTGGTIRGNTGGSGAVYINSSNAKYPTTFTMTGGEISGNENTSSYYGGGVRASGYFGELKLTGGVITGNTSRSGGGGGVYIGGNESNRVTINGTQIYGNTSGSDLGNDLYFDGHQQVLAFQNAAEYGLGYNCWHDDSYGGDYPQTDFDGLCKALGWVAKGSGVYRTETKALTAANVVLPPESAKDAVAYYVPDDSGASTGSTPDPNQFVYFKSLAEAMQVLLDGSYTREDGTTVTVPSGATIYLKQDFAETLSVPAVTFTLDLNGHTLTTAKANATIFTLKSGANMTLADTAGPAYHKDAAGTLTRHESYATGRGFDVQAGASLTIAGGQLTGFTMANQPGPAINCAGNLTITGGSVTDNAYTGKSDYGTIHVNNKESVVSITGGTFANNRAYSGGVLYTAPAKEVRIENVTFENNRASASGGAVAIYALNCPTTVTLKNVTFWGNQAGNNGGGLCTMDHHDSYRITLTMTDCAFDGNTAGNNAGGALLSYRTDATVSNLAFTNNTAKGSDGGGLYSDAATAIDFTGSVLFDGNTAFRNGGGLYQNRGTMTFTDAQFRNNHADGEGGAIAAQKMTLENCTLHDNDSAGHGGAVRHFGGQLTVEGGKFYNNKADNQKSTDHRGGAIYSYTGSGGLRLSGVEFYENEARTGGAVYRYDNSTSYDYYNVIENCKFHDNTATSGGALYVYVRTLADVTNVRDSEFNDNNAANGGAIYTDTTVNIYGCKIHDNEGRSSGGAIYHNSNNADCYVNLYQGAEIFNNTAYYGGGCRVSRISLNDNARIYNNTAKYHGGGVYGYTILRDSAEIDHNKAEMYDGGGVYGSSKLEGGSVHENTANRNGGGIYGNLTINNGEIWGNTAKYDGGGVNSDSLTMTGGTIRDNTAGRYGGGVGREYWAATFKMYGGEIRDNYAGVDGGGVYAILNRGDVVSHYWLAGGRITGNTAARNGGGAVLGQAQILGELRIYGSMVITGNHAGNYGGGIYFYYSSQQEQSLGIYTDEEHPTVQCALYGNTAALGQDYFIPANSKADISRATKMNLPANLHVRGWLDERTNNLIDTEIHGINPKYWALTLAYTDSSTVAAVGEELFSSVGDAVAYVQAHPEDSHEIVMVADSRENVTVPAGVDVTLNLNGHTLQGFSTAITLNGALTLKDEVNTDYNGRVQNIGAGPAGQGTIKGNAAAYGGGFVVQNGGELTINSGNLSECYARTGGAAIYVNGGKATMNGGKIHDCYSTNGAIYVNKSKSTFVLNGGEISGNYNAQAGSTTFGSGTLFNNGGRLQIQGGTIHDNRGLNVVYSTGTTAETSITGGSFTNNQLVGSGSGVIRVEGGTTTVSGTGAAPVVISGNTVTGNGGAAYVGSGSLYLSYAELKDNTVTSNGGAIYQASGTMVIAAGTLITGNTAGNKGGAIYQNGGTAQILAGTISNNRAPVGGGIAQTATGANCTVFDGVKLYENVSTVSNTGNDIYSAYEGTADWELVQNKSKMTLEAVVNMGSAQYNVWRDDAYSGANYGEAETLAEGMYLTGNLNQCNNLRLTTYYYKTATERQPLANNRKVSQIILSSSESGSAFISGSYESPADKVKTQEMTAAEMGWPESSETYQNSSKETLHYLIGADGKLYERNQMAQWTPGEDGSEDSTLVLSNDTVVYNVCSQFAASGGETEDITNTEKVRVWMEVELDADSSQASITKPDGFQGYVLSETQDGKPIQTMRCYKEISVAQSDLLYTTLRVNVLAMRNGQTLKPRISVWVEGNEENEQNHPTIDCDRMTVSAAGRYNVTLKQNSKLAYTGYFDTTSGQEASRPEEGEALQPNVVYGTVLGYGVTVMMFNTDDDGKTIPKNKGIKGLEIPADGLEMELHMRGGLYLDGAPVDVDGQGSNLVTPIFWALKENEQSDYGRGKGQSSASFNMNWDDEDEKDICSNYAYNAAPFNTGNNEKACYNGGGWTLTGIDSSADETVLHLKVSGYAFDMSNTNPKQNSDGSNSEQFNNDYTKPFTAGYLQMIFPFPESVMSQANGYLSVDMQAAVSDVKITSASGQNPVVGTDPSTLVAYYGDQAQVHATGEIRFEDNRIASSNGLYVYHGSGDGTGISVINYWLTGDRGTIAGDRGDGTVPLGSQVYVGGSLSYSSETIRTDEETRGGQPNPYYIPDQEFNPQTDNKTEFFYATGINMLQKFDADAFTPLPSSRVVNQRITGSYNSNNIYVASTETATNWSNGNLTRSMNLTVLYAAKPDGTNWAKVTTTAQDKLNAGEATLQEDGSILYKGQLYRPDQPVCSDGGVGEMDYYHEENLIYFETLDDLNAYFVATQGKTDAKCVAILYQARDCCIRTGRNIRFEHKMQATDDFAYTGQTYCTTNESRIWTTYRPDYKLVRDKDDTRKAFLYDFNWDDVTHLGVAKGLGLAPNQELSSSDSYSPNAETKTGYVPKTVTITRRALKMIGTGATDENGNPIYEKEWISQSLPQQLLQNAKHVSNGYIKTEYEYGCQKAGTHNGNLRGNTLLLHTLRAEIKINGADKEIDSNADKNTYNLSEGERIVNFVTAPKLTAASGISNSLVTDGSQSAMVSIDLTFPAGIAYREGSVAFDYTPVKVNGKDSPTYAEGELEWAIGPVQKNEDGTSTLHLTTCVSDISKNLPKIMFSGFIGSESEGDVQNGAVLTTEASIYASYEEHNQLAAIANRDSFAITIIKDGLIGIYQEALAIADESGVSTHSLLTEVGEDFGFKLAYYNQDTVHTGGIALADVLPYNGDGRGTKFDGGYRIKQIQLVFGGAGALETAAFYAQSGDLYLLHDSINPADQLELFTDKPGSATALEKPALVPDVENARYTFTYDIPEEGYQVLSADSFSKLLYVSLPNVAGKTYVYANVILSPLDRDSTLITSDEKTQQGGDQYCNDFAAKPANAEQIMSSLDVDVTVVQRTITGYAFMDMNQDGKFTLGNEADSYLKNVTVMLYQAGNTRAAGNDGLTPAKDVMGIDVDPVQTDEKGRYVFNNVAPGNYIVVFSDPNNQYVWKDRQPDFHELAVTIRPGADSGYNTTASDVNRCTAIYDENGLAELRLAKSVEMPQRGAMKTAKYSSTNNNAGLYCIEAKLAANWTGMIAEVPEGTVLTYQVRGGNVYSEDFTITQGESYNAITANKLPKDSSQEAEPLNAKAGLTVPEDKTSDCVTAHYTWESDSFYLQAKDSVGNDITYSFTETLGGAFSETGYDATVTAVKLDANSGQTIFEVNKHQRNHELSVMKVDAKDMGKGLSEAQFQIGNEAAPMKFVRISEGYYRVCCDNYDKSGESKVTVGANGALKLIGLPEGTLTLTEVKAPKGYVRPDGSWTVKIDEGGVTPDSFKDNSVTEKLPAIAVSGSTSETTDAQGKPITTTSYEYFITNVQHKQIPITGADGIGGYLIVGLTFMTAGALLLLEYRRRKRANGAV